MAAAIPDTRDEYQELFNVYWPIGVGIFVVIVALTAFIVLRFRSASREFPKGKDKSHAEEGYAVLVGLIVALLLLLTYNTMSDLPLQPTAASGAKGRPEGSELVRVTAARWHWRFDYPEHGATSVGTDTRPATLGVPVDRPVYFEQTSLDVIHSFWIPERRFKTDAFPGRTTKFALRFPDEGFWRAGGECNQYCGLQHQEMVFNVQVMSPERFRRWLADRRRDGRAR